MKKYICKKCGNNVGELVERDGVTLLKVGDGIFVRTLHAECECGEQIHFCADVAYIRLMKAIEKVHAP